MRADTARTFAGSMRGGRAAAIVFTLIECCRLAKVDMVSYLADVLVRVASHLASQIAELLPDHWATQFAPPAPRARPRVGRRPSLRTRW